MASEMTCPCIHMREAAAKVCDIHADERAWIPNEAVTDEHRYRDYEAERALRNAARAIRSLPLCGRCESHVDALLSAPPSELEVAERVREACAAVARNSQFVDSTQGTIEGQVSRAIRALDLAAVVRGRG